ncbi:MAG: cytochrome-c peroxidase, partial [Planctomycetes bacterium]|nr:cytochrome-c peroxidase [Planctomycetota bacterium]
MVRARHSGIVLALALVGLLGSVRSSTAQPPPPPPLPPVPVPIQNPITESKRVLGKILFWDEQLSSDNSTACGTCHMPGFNGTDPRIARNPSDDGILNTPDDVLGSPGVIRCDDEQTYKEDAVFGFNRQITPRAANPAIMAMYAPEIFWDGRARSTFVNPQTGAVSIPVGGALESQAVGPVVSDVEMGHESRDWNSIVTKLAVVKPMILAEHWPWDVGSALAANGTYPELFAAAFGDSTITAERIAFAIATYERTLVPNQTPFDRFAAGEANAMTPNQVQGFNALQASPCVICHAGPQFTNNSFQNIGL